MNLWFSLGALVLHAQKIKVAAFKDDLCKTKTHCLGTGSYWIKPATSHRLSKQETRKLGSLECVEMAFNTGNKPKI